MKKNIILSSLILILFCFSIVALTSCDNKNNFNFDEEVKKIEFRLENKNKDISKITKDDIKIFNYDKKLDVSIINIEKKDNNITVNFKVKYKNKEKLSTFKINVYPKPPVIENFNFDEEVKKIEAKIINEEKDINEITKEDIEFFNYDKKLDVSIINIEKKDNNITVNFKVKYKNKEKNKILNIKMPKIEDFTFKYSDESTALELKEDEIQIENKKNFKIFEKKIINKNYNNIQIKIKTNNGVTLYKNLKTNVEKFKKGKNINNVEINKYGLILDLLNLKGYFNNNLQPSKIAENIGLNSILYNDIISLKIVDIAYNDNNKKIIFKIADFKILNENINLDNNEVTISTNYNLAKKINSSEIKTSKNLDYQDLLIKNKIKLTEFLQNSENLKKFINLSSDTNLNLYKYNVEFYNIREKENNKFSYSIKIKENNYSKNFEEEKKLVENYIFDEIKSFEEKYYSAEDVLDYIVKNEIISDSNLNNFPSFYKEVIDRKIKLESNLIDISQDANEIFTNYFGLKYIYTFDLSCNSISDLNGTMNISASLKAFNEDENITNFSRVSKTIEFTNMPKFSDFKKEITTFTKQNDEKFRNKLKELIDKNKELLLENKEVVIDKNNNYFNKFFSLYDFNFDLSNEAGNNTLNKYNDVISKHIKLYLGERYLEFNEIFNNEKGVYFLKLGKNNDKYIALDGISIKINNLKVKLNHYNDNGESRFHITIGCTIKYIFKNSTDFIERDATITFPMNYKIK